MTRKFWMLAAAALTPVLCHAGPTFVSDVGTATAAQAVTVNITTAGTLNAIQALTQGAANLDFTMAAGGTCATGTAYTVGQTCTVNVIFTPQLAGIRNGALLLTDAGGNVLGTTYLPGEGMGPQIVFAPPLQSNVLPKFTSGPVGVAVDASGNVYAVDSNHNAVVKVPWTGSGYGTPVNLGSGYTQPIGVAVDGAGNVYVGDYGGFNVVKIPWNGSAYGPQVNVPLGATLREPRHLTVDGNGNIYFADYALDEVVEVPWTGTAYGALVVLPFTGINSVNGVAVDSNGDVFCANSYAYNVLMLPWTGAGYGTQVTVTGGLTGLPIAVALDPAGNVYAAIQSKELVLKIPPTGPGTYGPPMTVPVANLSGIWDVGLDGTANVFVADYLGQQVYKVDLANAPSLTFNQTDVGSTSSDSPKTVTVSNIGNAAMAFTAGTNPEYPTDFPVNSADTNLCSPANPLAVDGSCDVSINFEPTTGGPLAEHVVLTDDDLNKADATQSIAVTGMAIPATAPVVSFSPNPIAFTDQIAGTISEAMAVTLSNTGNATLTGISAALGGTDPGDFAVSTTGTNGCASSLSAGSSCFFYVTFAPNMAVGYTATLMVADNASGSPQSIPISGTGINFASNVGAPTPSQAVTVDITTAGTLNTIQVLTQGAANLDFTMASGGTCATGTAYTVGQTCTVNVIFTPHYAGTRNGAILLTDPSSNALGTTYLPGIGNGPQIVFGPGVETSVPGSQVTPWGVAVDGAGNVYTNNTNFGTVLQIPWTGSAYGTAVTIATDVANAFGKSIAVDGAGNVFVGSNEPGAIVTEIPRTPTGWGAQLIVPTSVGGAFGITVDGVGSLYIADSSGQVVKLPWTGNGYGTQITLPATGLISPYGVAVDGSGNVYIADHDANIVVELPWTGSGYGTQTTVPSAGLTNLTGLAVDGTSNLYVAGGAGSGSEIVRIPWSGSAYGTPTVLPGFDYTQVAVDGAGNVYGVEGLYANEELGIFKIDLADPPSLSFASTNVGFTSTDSPQTVSITNIGNVDLYFNAAINNPVYPVDFPINNNDTNPCVEDDSVSQGNSCDVSVNFTPTTGGPLLEYVVLTDNDLNGAGATQSISVSGTAIAATAPVVSFSPNPIAFTDQIVGTTSEPIAVMLSNTGNATLSNINATLGGTDPGVFAVSTSGTNGCTSSLAAGSSCFFYVTFLPASAVGYTAKLMVADNASGSPQSIPISGTGINFVSNVGAATASQAVTVNITTAGTVSSIQVLTQGAANLDFTMVPGGTCSTEDTFSVGKTCTVDVIFKPAYAGARRGAVLLTDSSNNMLGTTFLPGTGTGPQIAFLPGNQTTLPAPADSYHQPFDITVDASENVYLTDAGNNRIVQLPWTGSGYGTPVIVPTSGLKNPTGVAVDGSGNLWISDNGNARIVEVPWTGSSYGTQIVVIGSGLNTPEGITVDGNGNVFYIDVDRVYELPWTATGYGPVSSSLTNGLSTPIGLAVDANESLYIADSENNEVYELPWTASGFGALTTIASSLQSPQGVAVDGGGNVYIANTGAATVLEVPWNGAAFGTPVQVPFGGLDFPTSIAVDGGGNIYLADNGNSDAAKLDVVDAPSYTFANTNVGSTSSDSPKTTTVENIGNAPLTFAAGTNPNYPANFPVNSSDTSLCGPASPLAQGATCDVSIDFQPTTGGSLSGFVVLTDNDLNVTGTTQSIAVSGFGSGGQVATPQISPPTGTYFTNQSVTITDATSESGICYTTDDTTPTADQGGSCTNGTAYSSAISVAKTGTTIKAIGALSGHPVSDVASATYTLQTVAPTLTPPGGTYTGPQAVALATTTTGAQIYYTTDGSTPTGSAPSILYAGTPVAITVSGTVLNAIAVNSGYVNSTVSTGTYTLALPAATLTPSLAFPATTAGTTAAAMAATLTNGGNAPLTGIAISITGTNPSDFALTTGSSACGASLAAGSSCSIYVTFTPASAASFTATLSVADNATGSPQTSTLTGTGNALPDFTISTSPATQTVAAGAAATYTVTVQSVNGNFSGEVSLSATGLPPGATASFQPGNVVPGSGSAPSTLTVQTAAASAAVRGVRWPLATPVLALLVLLPFRRWRRAWRGRFLLLIAGLASLGLLATVSGCGGGFALINPQTYTLTITGATEGPSHSTTVQLTVQ